MAAHAWTSARVASDERSLARQSWYQQHGSYNHYYQGVYSGSEIQIKSRCPNVTWKRITIADSVSSGTWFRELYVPSSNCICYLRFDHTRATVYARDNNKVKAKGRRRTGLVNKRGSWRRKRGFPSSNFLPLLGKLRMARRKEEEDDVPAI